MDGPAKLAHVGSTRVAVHVILMRTDFDFQNSALKEKPFGSNHDFVDLEVSPDPTPSTSSTQNKDKTSKRKLFSSSPSGTRITVRVSHVNSCKFWYTN